MKMRDIVNAARKGVLPGDPRFVSTVQRCERQRKENTLQDKTHQVAAQTSQMGFTKAEEWDSPSQWLANNPNVRSPIWLHPETKVELWKRGNQPVRLVFRMPEDIYLFECFGKGYLNVRRII